MIGEFLTAFFKFKKTEPAEIFDNELACVFTAHLYASKNARLKSTTTNGWRHFGQSEQRKSSVLFPIQLEKSPDSDFFACDL